MIQIRYTVLRHAHDLPEPRYQTEGAAGFDLIAAVDRAIHLEPGRRALVPTGICVEIPLGFEGQVRPRSGLALRHGITVLNSPGTIDADYRGELQVLLINLGENDFLIERGDRIAQFVLHAVAKANLTVVKSLTDTPRAGGGFGSTGQR